jgi:hypothetical protein
MAEEKPTHRTTPMKLDRYPYHPGADWETGNVANCLAAAGVTDPRTGQAYTETLLFGVGGGIGGGYFLWEMCGWKCVAIGFRHDWQKYKGEFTETFCRRLGIPYTAHEAGGAKRAEADLLAALEAGHPVWATVAEAALAYRGLPREFAKGYVYGVSVCGCEDDHFLLGDLAPQPVKVSREEFAFARGIITANKNRFLAFTGPGRPADLKAAVREGLRQCAAEMLNPPIRNFGASAWEKWADLLVNPKDKKGWPSVMTREQDLKDALRSVYAALLKDGGTDGQRNAFAAFLDEAGSILDLPALDGVAGSYRRLAAEWRAFALAALPDSVPALAELRGLLEQRGCLLRTTPSTALAELQRLRAREDELVAADGALAPDQQQQLCADLSDRLRRLHAAEVAAAEALRSAV